MHLTDYRKDKFIALDKWAHLAGSFLWCATFDSVMLFVWAVCLTVIGMVVLEFLQGRENEKLFWGLMMGDGFSFPDIAADAVGIIWWGIIKEVMMETGGVMT